MRFRDVIAGLVLVVSGACGGELATKPSIHPPLRDLHNTNVAVQTKPERVKVLPASASRVPFTRMLKHPEPGWNVPRSVAHVPDGNSITYLASETGDETMSLMSFDTTTGATSVLLRAKDLVGDADKGPRSREEELRRERQRDRNEGITQYSWAKKAKVLLLPHSGDVFVRDFVKEPTGAVRRLTKTADAEIDPKLCETGEKIAFVRKGELFAIDVATGKEVALTTQAREPKTNAVIAEGVTHGLSDFVAQEELGEPSGFFWSPKCDRILYLEVDERSVDTLPVLGYRKDSPDLMMQRYPRAGTKNPIVRAALVDLATRKTTWVDWRGSPSDGEKYLGRFLWNEDGKSVYVQTITRDQKRLTLDRIDAVTGKATQVLSETSTAWVSFSPMKLLRGPSTDPMFVFTSSKTGHRHIDIRSAKDGSIVRTLTSGDFDADPVAVDHEHKTVLFTAQGSTIGPGATSSTRNLLVAMRSLNRQLYVVSLNAPHPVLATQITTEGGVHSVRINESATTWVDVHSASNRLPKAVVVREGTVLGELPVLKDPDLEALDIRPAEHVQIKAADGETMLNAAVLKPRKLEGRHPAIVMVYGGPEAQLVFDMWSPRLLWQHLADRGFVVFQVDNRGSGGRGPAFAQKVHKQLGKLELEDQIAGAKWLGAQSFVDPERIGIYGHSYGGFMAALAMLDERSKGVFRAGVAGSPVTDWRLYDTGYTERYMDSPQTNAAGYEASDLSKKAAGLSGKLLITHAMMDENVHYAHTAKLVDALIAADKHFDLLVLPGERHGLRAPAARTYVPERVAEFFAENL